MTAIELDNVVKSYRLGFWRTRTVRALRGLSLRIEPGKVFGLIGPNGAGKSTTIKILMNLVRPTQGQARIFGLPVSDQAARQGLGYLPENPAPYEYLTGREFVRVGAQLAKVPAKDVTRLVDESLARVGLDRAANLTIRRYSKGMTQRVVLAAALVGQPKLLVLDEPTSGLDPIGRRLVRDVILEERQRGTTVLFCSHIISDVETLCDELAVLIAGQCVKQGSVQQLLSGQADTVEVSLEGTAEAAVRSWGVPVEQVTAAAGRVLVRMPEAGLHQLLTAAMSNQGQVRQVVPVRYSLEEMFLKALKDSGAPTVGGVIE